MIQRSELTIPFKTYLPITGDTARHLPHLKDAIDGRSGALDVNKITCPNVEPSFSLTIIDIPWSTQNTFPGITPHRTFTVKLHRDHYVFGAGDWQDLGHGLGAIVQCFSYTKDDEGLFFFNQQGLLRIPTAFVIELSGTSTHSTPPNLAFRDRLLHQWRSIPVTRRWDVLLTFPLAYPHDMGGSLWLEPSSIDERSLKIETAVSRFIDGGCLGHTSSWVEEYSEKEPEVMTGRKNGVKCSFTSSAD